MYAHGQYPVSPEGGLIFDAYVALCQLPHSGKFRMEAQHLMASLRDMLAQDCGAEPQYVQDYVERAAARRAALKEGK